MALGTSAMENQAGGGTAAVLSLEPVAAVRDPPAHERYWDGCDQSPPDGQLNVCDQTEHAEHDPEDLLLHPAILERHTD
jgi:hypothetical protein